MYEIYFHIKCRTDSSKKCMCCATLYGEEHARSCVHSNRCQNSSIRRWLDAQQCALFSQAAGSASVRTMAATTFGQQQHSCTPLHLKQPLLDHGVLPFQFSHKVVVLQHDGKHDRVDYCKCTPAFLEFLVFKIALKGYSAT